MTEPKNTLPPNSAKPTEDSKTSLPETDQSVENNTKEPSPTEIEPLASNTEPSASDKSPSALDKSPSALDKEPSVSEKEHAAGDKTPTTATIQAAAESSQPQHEPVSKPSEKQEKPRSGNMPPPINKSGQARFAVFMSILAVILLAACSLYFWQKQLQQSMQIDQLLEKASADKQSAATDHRSVLQQLGKLNDQLFNQQNTIAQLSQQTAFNNQKLADLGARSRMDWLLAEAEYLMRLANQRLTLEHDIQSAEAMLSSADSILAEINDPGLNEIRKTLANEILSLQQVRHLDHQGLYFKLEALNQSIDALKQQAFLDPESSANASSENNLSTSQNTPSPASENYFLEVWRTIWRDLKQAVTIRRLDQPLPPLLAPEQHYYLKQNLRLMLEQASLALLEENTIVYQASLNKADAWLKQYFMQNDPIIQQIQATLNELASYQISINLPDISHSLRLTKAKIESFYRQHTLNKLSAPDTSPQSDSKQSPDSQGAARPQGATL